MCNAHQIEKNRENKIMDRPPNTPRYERGFLASFVSDLRSGIFRYKTEAAEYFNLHHTTIGRYENVDNLVRPKVGYLAALAMLWVEKCVQDDAARDSAREHLLDDVNRAIRSEYYLDARPFQNWDDLEQTAKAYLAEQQGEAAPHKSQTEVALDPNVPFQAPPLPPQGIIGRNDALGQLTELLAFDDEHAKDVRPVALRGMGGIGKTTLAIALARLGKAHQLFPDGILWTALGPNPTVRLHLDSWGRALGVDLLPERDEDACRDRLRAVLYHRRVLIMVDDVWDAAHGNYFQIAGPQCRTVFTTREVPVANDLATRERTLRVDVLKPKAALELLRRLSPEAVDTDKKLAMRLCERLEFLPLGLTLAGRLLANEADVPSRMQRLVGELIERREDRLKLLQTEGRLGLDEEQPASIQAILGLSVNRLGKIDQDRFAMLAVFGGEPLTWEINAASYVWECTVEQAEDTVSRLIQRGLVERRDDRYWMHALLADYAEEMMEDRGL